MHLSEKERYEQELDAIDWTLYATAYGPAVDVPRQLLALAFGTTEEAMNSASDLWAGLCHQQAYISSAAPPAYPFLVQVLESADEQLAIELLDIFTGFAVCCGAGARREQESFYYDIEKMMKRDIEFFRTFRELDGEGGFSDRIVRYLSADA